MEKAVEHKRNVLKEEPSVQFNDWRYRAKVKIRGVGVAGRGRRRSDGKTAVQAFTERLSKEQRPDACWVEPLLQNLAILSLLQMYEITLAEFIRARAQWL